MDKLRLVIDIEGVTGDQVLEASPFRLTGQDGFDVAAEPVAMGAPERIDRGPDVQRAVAEQRADDREAPEGRSNDARLMRWVKASVPDTRVRQEGTEPVTMTGGELFDLLYQVTDWAYRTGTADVGESPRRLAEFFGSDHA